MIRTACALAAATIVASIGWAPVAAAAPGAGHSIGRSAVVSSGCRGQNAEVLQAVDRKRGYVYEEWMGCRGIGFARSTDRGKTFGSPISLPGTNGLANSWDPVVTVAPDGTVYAAFMIARSGYYYPVIATSFDHGLSFPQVASLVPPSHRNWGDRPFLAAGPDGVVYLTWDYGPDRSVVTYICDPTGSCAFATGDLNTVIQRSTDHGKTWGPIIPVSPGFPASGGDSAPLLLEPNGRIDLTYQGYHITNTTTYAMTPAHTYFTSSTDGGATWSTPVRLGPAHLTMSLAEWWIDGALSSDSVGNLYATWDTQGASDVGWMSFSTDHGKHWSDLVRVTPPDGNALHIMEVAGGRAGVAYVSWLTDAGGAYRLFLRPYSISKGWLVPPILVSNRLGDVKIWPGDTTGISTFSSDQRDASGDMDGTRVVLSWGSAYGSSGKSAIHAAVVDFHQD
jgi:hypothetical protein